jgi:hypothetical protein
MHVGDSTRKLQVNTKLYSRQNFRFKCEICNDRVFMMIMIKKMFWSIAAWRRKFPLRY